MNVRSALAKYVEIVNEFGAESAEAKQFYSRHADNQEFSDLARLTVNLKNAISSRTATKAQ